MHVPYQTLGKEYLGHLLDGVYHHNIFPVQISRFGSIFWRHSGKLHRTNGPAFIGYTGNKEWFLLGDFHRIGGPARIFKSFSEYFLWGKQYSEKEYWEELEKLNLK